MADEPTDVCSRCGHTRMVGCSVPDNRYPSTEIVESRPPAAKWGLIDNDGNRACWWCLCTVHPSVVELHDRWHLRNWEDQA